MRVTETERRDLRDAALDAFGSRVDDARRVATLICWWRPERMGTPPFSKRSFDFWPGSRWLLGNKKSTCLWIT